MLIVLYFVVLWCFCVLFCFVVSDCCSYIYFIVLYIFYGIRIVFHCFTIVINKWVFLPGGRLYDVSKHLHSIIIGIYLSQLLNFYVNECAKIIKVHNNIFEMPFELFQLYSFLVKNFVFVTLAASICKCLSHWRIVLQNLKELHRLVLYGVKLVNMVPSNCTYFLI